jgi:hypothetical protein
LLACKLVVSRNIIQANKSIFVALDKHCATRGSTLQNAGKPRWIASKKKHHHFMASARVSDLVHFGPGRKLARFELSTKLARFELSTKCYLCSVGFEPNEGLLSGAKLDLDPALLTVALSELQPRPSATFNEIRQIVEWSDKETDDRYQGHEHEQIASLFPLVCVYDMDHGKDKVIWNTFFNVCIDECELGSSWIEGSLADALRSMCDLDQQRIPYRVLCRSIFDGDRSSFFLALYRCLEALYAYSSARSLAGALEISKPWGEIATVLEDELGWHPREEGSLTRIIKFATPTDLRAILHALGCSSPGDQELLINRAAKAIYGLRNSIVHYRPAQHRVDMESFDWLRICAAMVGVILDVYEAVFTGQPA